MGKIVAAGPGKVSDNGSVVKMSVQKGDQVLYGKYSGTEITLDGTEVLIMRESDILAKFK
jgi:chaperonin GroES